MQRRAERTPRPGGPLVLYGKPECCLCDRAKSIVARLAAEYGLDLRQVSIAGDPELFARLRFRIPVVALDGQLLDEGNVTEFRLRRALDRALPRRGGAGHASP